jgi:hypothetical protein
VQSEAKADDLQMLSILSTHPQLESHLSAKYVFPHEHLVKSVLGLASSHAEAAPQADSHLPSPV